MKATFRARLLDPFLVLFSDLSKNIAFLGRLTTFWYSA